MTTVSIILPTHDRVTSLGHALAGIAAQTHRDLEVIVVNDGGPLLDLSPWRRILDLKLVDLNDNVGPARARCAGLDVAEGEVVAFLDDDDCYFPEHLARCVAPIAAGEADLVYPIVVHSPQRLRALPDRLPAGAHARSLPFDPRFLQVACFFPASGIVCRRVASAVRFDTSLRACETWELALRLALREGLRFQHVPATTAACHHLPSGDSAAGGRDASRRRRFIEARRRLAARYPAADPLIQQHRSHLLAFHKVCGDVRREGGVPEDFSEERFIGALYESFRAGESIPDIEHVVRQLVTRPRACAVQAQAQASGGRRSLR